MITRKLFSNKKDARRFFDASVEWLSERYGSGTFMPHYSINEIEYHFRKKGFFVVPEGHQFGTMLGFRHHELWEGCVYSHYQDDDAFIVAFRVPDEYVALEMNLVASG